MTVSFLQMLGTPPADSPLSHAESSTVRGTPLLDKVGEVLPNESRPLTAESLRAILHYDGGTGVFTWKVGVSTRRHAGSVAGRPDTDGYCVITIQKKNYKAHRLAWLYVHGRWPDELIDHINGDPHDNRIDNLRECSPQENNQNRRLSCSNTSGFPGVSRLSGKWRACIQRHGKKHHLGLYDTPEEASAACERARLLLQPNSVAGRLITHDEKSLAICRATDAMQAAFLEALSSGLTADQIKYATTRANWERVVTRWMGQQ